MDAEDRQRSYVAKCKPGGLGVNKAGFWEFELSVSS